MNGIAYYRGADTNEILTIAGRVVPFKKGLNGFIIKYFASFNFVILNEHIDLDKIWLEEEVNPENQSKQDYEKIFHSFHDRLTDGTFDKIVLSRRKWTAGNVDAYASFEKACEMYKDQTVVLFSSQLTGTWLIATPELLLDMDSDKGKTIALAGTMSVGEGEWSDKNRAEHRIVADFIRKKLNNYCSSVSEEPTHTVRAGNLLHLQTNFSFVSETHWTEIVDRLNPTPAVCGYRAAAAADFIVHNEGYDRRCYTGYTGLAMDDACLLHVTLRCVQIMHNGYWLYAGGGIMPESNAESEWNETENKMETIRKCIVTR